MTAVKDMSADERSALVGKIADCLKKYESISDKVKIVTSRETVCALAAADIQDSFTIEVKGSLGPDLKKDVDAFKAEVEGLKCEGLKIDVSVKLGPGC